MLHNIGWGVHDVQVLFRPDQYLIPLFRYLLLLLLLSLRFLIR